MKNIVSLFLLLTLFSCEKAIEKAQEDAVIQIMVNGRWVVTSFVKGSTDVTADFSGYQFQFKENRTVDAIKNGVVEKTGSWEGNATARTITSQFSNAVPPLSLLNGAFYIEDTSPTYVKASLTVNGELRTLRLDKQ